MTTPATDTTTHDTALAVIERHLSEWQRDFETADRDGHKGAAAHYAGGVNAFTVLRDELRGDTTTPDAWNADTSPFDPVRAGMEVLREQDGPNGWLADGGDFLLIQWAIGSDGASLNIESLGASYSLPADLPHNVVISILRANGWTGGDDESV